MLMLALFSAFANDPRVSTSRGKEGGVLVLNPRIIPASEDPAILALAAAITAHAEAVARQARPDAKVDARPAPQRTCPQAGCLGASIGSVLVHTGKTCAVAAWVAAPGQSPARALAWSTGLEVGPEPIAFREPIESHLKVHDYQPCESILESLGARDADVVDALKAVSGG